MYSTVKQCHIALDYELQQVASNRKQSIQPEYLDMALNEAVLQFIETRSNRKTNSKKEGFEESQKRYDDLKDLKRQVLLKCINDSVYNDRVYTILPDDYFKLIPSECLYEFNKRVLPESVTTLTRTVYKYNLSTIEYPYDDPLKVVRGTTEIDLSDFIKLVKSADGRFYTVNLLVDSLRRLKYSVYYETYDDVYEPECLFVVLEYSEAPHVPITGIDPVSVDTVSHSVINNTSNKQSALRLLSTSDVRDNLNNYHSSSNAHLNPICEIIYQRLNVYHNDVFIPCQLIVNYIKKPRVIDYITNTMCEVTMTHEIIKLAALHLKGLLKDDGYNIAMNEKIINE